MLKHRRGVIPTPRNAEVEKRDGVLGGVSSIIAGLSEILDSSNRAVASASSLSNPLNLPTLPTIPFTGLPTIPTLPSSLSLPVITDPLPTISIISLPNDTSSLILPSSSTSLPSVISIPQTSASQQSESDPSESPTSSSFTLSDFTTTFTTMSGTTVVTVTSIVRPSGSLASTPDTGSDFLHNKVQAGIVFAIVALLAICGFGFLGYRFFKTVKARQLERESEDAVRSARYRVRIDDDDDDTGTSHMTETRNGQTLDGHAFDFLRGSTTEGRPSSETSHYTPSSHSHHLLTPQDGSTSHQSSFNAPCSTRTLRRVSSIVTGINEDNYLINRPTRSNTVGASSLISDTIHRSPSTSTSQSHKVLYIPHEPLPPSLPLPETFGEDGGSVHLPQWEEDEDEYELGSVGRVLKVANE